MCKRDGGLRTKSLFSKKTKQSRPLISVITVVKNSEKYLERTIQSVINQIYDNIEYIIIDGVSTDGTLDIVRKYENKIAYWVSEPDTGIYDAMNKGVRLSSGEYVYFLNSGDYLYNNRVFLNLTKSMRHNFAFVYGKINLITEDGHFHMVTGKKVKLKELIYGMVCHQALLVRRKSFDKIGFFNTKFKVASDYEWVIRLFKAYEFDSKYVDIVIANMIMGGHSDVSAIKGIKERREIVKRYFGIMNYTKYYVYSFFYEIPRNRTRLVLTKFGLIQQWRKIKKLRDSIFTRKNL